MFDQAVLRQAFSEWCEREIARRLEQLAPLETGEMHLGRRGADTGFEWVDETEKQIHPASKRDHQPPNGAEQR
jgi:hypothetical protein